MIDFNIAIIFAPMVLAGSLIGVILNNILPSAVILIILSLTLLTCGSMGLHKAIKLFKEETKKKEFISKIASFGSIANSKENSKRNINQVNTVEHNVCDEPNLLNKISTVQGLKANLLDGSLNNINIDKISINDLSIDDHKKLTNQYISTRLQKDLYDSQKVSKQIDVGELFCSQREKIMKSESLPFPPVKMLFILGCIIFTILFQFVQGSNSTKSIVGIKLCTPSYWVVMITYGVIMVLFAVFAS